MPSARRRAGILAAALLGAGCLHAFPRARAVPDCPGALAPTQAIAGEFLLRQRLVVTQGERSFALELVAQKRGDELLLLGFDPLGAELFRLRQRGLETRVDAAPAPFLEVPPLNALRDLHRARFLGIASPGAGRVTIENEACGYRAELTTLSEQALP